VAALAGLSRRWRGDATERRFSMALGRLFDRRDPDALVVPARDGDGRLRGFLHFVPSGADGASLDVMRRDHNASSCLNDFLVVEATCGLPRLGIRRLSLNFSFPRAVLAAGAGAEAPLRLLLASVEHLVAAAIVVAGALTLRPSHRPEPIPGAAGGGPGRPGPPCARAPAGPEEAA